MFVDKPAYTLFWTPPDYIMKRHKLYIPLITVILVLLSACSSAPTKREKQVVAPVRPQISHQQAYRTPSPRLPAMKSVGVFPKPAALEPAVDFWRKTYGVWRRSEVAFYDDRYMDVIYEVMVLPGSVGEGLTNEQKELVSRRKEYWKSQLTALDFKVRARVPLNPFEKQLYANLQSSRNKGFVLAGASERLRSQRGIKERFKRGLEISGRYDSQFRKIFREYSLPEDFAFLPHVESSFQASAKSSAGAVGMWQFTRGAAETFMPGNNKPDRRHDPIASAHGAARYLRHAYNKLGDWPTAVTSYNHGINGMKRAQNQIGNDFARIVQNYNSPLFGFDSRNYYAQFLAARDIASNPMAYFREGVSYERPMVRAQYLAAE
jgi:membrane-bound lytic murein transglycosylase D